MKKLFLLLVAVLMVGFGAMAQTKLVSGSVVYAGDGEPLVGASVIPVGGRAGVITDFDGNFTIQVPVATTSLVISYVGMISQEVAIPDSGKIEVRLSNSENVLDEVMVVAYGTAKRASFTGSAAVVDAATLEDRLVSNVTNALSGTVAGVQTLTSNGQPGEGSAVRIRGIGSINASSAPLYVVDGVPFDGNIATINTADIESLSVLKDAAAAALYGARGANGVILVTTKRGQLGKAKVSVDARWGANSREIPNYDVVSDPARYLELVYQAQRNDALYNMGYSEAAAHNYATGQVVDKTRYQIYTVPDGEDLIGANGKINPNATLGYSNGKYYFKPDDWAKGTFRDGFRQEYNVGISAATDDLNYYVSFGYLSDEGVIKESNFERFSTRASIEYRANSWLKVGTNMSYANVTMGYPDEQTTSGSSANAFYAANNMGPIYPMYVRAADGTIMRDPENGRPIYDYGSGEAGVSRPNMSSTNPISDLIYGTSDFLKDVFSGKWYAQITPLEGLTITGNVSYNLDNTRFHMANSNKYGQSGSYHGEAEQVQTRTAGLNMQALAQYTKTFANVHNTDFMVGYESYEWNYESVNAYGQNQYIGGSWIVDNTLNGSKRTGGGSTLSYATRGFFGRVNYDYDSRYFFSGSYRRDASSCFHPDNRWGNFFSVSGAWNVANEAFMEGVTWVDLLKVKASFGQQGNDNFGRSASYPQYFYPYLDLYRIQGTDTWSDGNLYYKGNKDITWETSNSFNVGVDYSFFGSRLNGSIEFFNRQTSDMLYQKPVAPSNGYSSIPVNVGSMRNRGLEIDINGKIIETRDIVWSANFNLTYLENEILKLSPDLNGELIDGSTILQEGGPVYALYLAPYAGVDKATGVGLYWAKDEDGNEYATPNRSKAYNTNRKVIDVMPKAYGGFGTTLEAYGVDVSVAFAYQFGGKIWDYSYQRLMGSGTSDGIGLAWHKDIQNAWTPENNTSDIPRLDWSDSYSSASSDRWIISSNYLALNNVTAGYTFPSNWTKKLGVEQFRLYFVADNVAVWSARQGLDPRRSYLQGGNFYYSPIRTISGGVKVVF